jgi:signal transduction histidine kinase
MPVSRTLNATVQPGAGICPAYLSLARSSGESLLAVINDILDFSKIEGGKLDLDVVDFDLRDCVADAVRVLCPRAHSKGLELACDVSEDIAEHLMGDPMRLRQVIVNLVGNAVKFTAKGEIVLLAKLVADAPEVSDTPAVRAYSRCAASVRSYPSRR